MIIAILTFICWSAIASSTCMGVFAFMLVRHRPGLWQAIIMSIGLGLAVGLIATPIIV